MLNLGMSAHTYIYIRFHLLDINHVLGSRLGAAQKNGIILCPIV